ncbi:MAG: peptidylprolyl isomerase [Deltaproteobacteria bacterium]|nr:peptidylprolyl isomerase [Deltaproteobacteria bacterium]
MSVRFAVLVAVCVLLPAMSCKKKAEATSSGSSPSSAPVDTPAKSGDELAATTANNGATATTAGPTQPAEPPPSAPPVEVISRDIMSREPVTDAAQVRHILIGWMETSGQNTDPRAAKRTKEEADKLALDLLRKVRDGQNVQALMFDYSEDPGTAQSGDPYPVRPDGQFVPAFEALSLRLNVNEAGICETQFGYHIIKRVQ